MARYALSFDIGGTFTDFVLFEIESKEVRAFHKVLTTAQEPALGVLEGWRELIATYRLDPADIVLAVHSTTLVTNTIIERQGAVAGLLTTQGYRDVLEIGSEQIYDIYDLFAPYPAPLIEREHRIDIGERLAFDGSVIEPLKPDEVIAAVHRLVNVGVEAVAISFLHSYTDPRHEQQAEQAIKEMFPDLDVSISSRVAPLIGEYERTSTVAADAYVKPKVRRYLDDLVGQLRALGFEHDLNIMLSAGGAASTDVAGQYPIRLLESGPAAGGLAGAFYGRLAGLTEVIALDMGGTTAKLCLIEHGEPEVTQLFEIDRMHRFKPGSGLPVAIPAIDLVEIGAGGGSIAWIDNLGLLKIGPRSAASEPGPACYGRGGSEPTVSDANLILGYLDPTYFLGGRLTLDRGAAERAIRRRVAKPLGIDIAEAAWGIHSIVNGNMAAAARLHVLERNRDPRDFTLFVSGGAAPAHAVAVARLIGVRSLIFPLGIGVASAVGALVAPLSFSFTRTFLTNLDKARTEQIEGLYRQMEEEARRTLSAAGVDQRTVTVRRSVDLRYAGQYHTLEVPLPQGRLDPEWREKLREAFLERYRQRYGRAIEGLTIEAVNWKSSAEGGEARISLTPTVPAGGADAAEAIKGARPAYFPGPTPGYVDCPVYDRYRLEPGAQLVGPAIVEEREATIVLWPGDEARVDGYRGLLVHLNEEA